MASPLAEELNEIEATDVFRGSTEEEQRGMRQRFVAESLEVDATFSELPEDLQNQVRDEFLHRPFPKPPITAARAAEVAIQSVTGLPSQLAAIVPGVAPVLGGASLASRAIAGDDLFSRQEPLTEDEASQLDPAVAQVFGTIARLRLGVEKRTLALGGLAPPIARLLKDRFATQEDLVQAIEKAGGIGPVRAALTDIGGQFIGEALVFVAGAKVLGIAKSGVDILKKVGVSAGGAGLPLRVAGGSVIAGGQGVGALLSDPGTAPPVTDVPVIGPPLQKLAEVAGPADPETGEVTLRQQVAAFAFEAPFGALAAPLIPGRTTKPAVRPVSDGTKAATGVTKGMQDPVVNEVQKTTGLSNAESRAAVLDAFTAKVPSSANAQIVRDALGISSKAADSPAGEVIGSHNAKREHTQAEFEVDSLADSESLTLKSPDGGSEEVVKFVLGNEPKFRDITTEVALRPGSDKQLAIAIRTVVKRIDEGWIPDRWIGRDLLAMQRLDAGIRAAFIGREIDLPSLPDIPPLGASAFSGPVSPQGTLVLRQQLDLSNVAQASTLSADVAKQMRRPAVQHPSKTGKTGAGTIERIPTKSMAKRVVSDLQNRGFVARVAKTQDQSNTLHVIWSIPNNEAAATMAQTLVKKSQADPTGTGPDGTKAGLDVQEQAAVQANAVNTETASKILRAPKPKLQKRKKVVSAKIPETDVELPNAALISLVTSARDAGNLRINKGPNVIEIADTKNFPIRRIEFGKDRVIPNVTAAISETASILGKIKAKRLDPSILKAQSIIARTIDNVIENANGLGVANVDELIQAGDIVRNLDMASPNARTTLNQIRETKLGVEDLDLQIPPDDFAFVAETLGPAEGVANDIIDVVKFIDDPATQKSPLGRNRPAPTEIPRVTEGARRELEAASHGQYADNIVEQRSAVEHQKMVNEVGPAVRLLKNTADRISDPRMSLRAEHPLQGHKITATVERLGADKTKTIVIRDSAVNETQTFGFNGNGLRDAVNYIKSADKRAGCKACAYGLSGPIVTGESRVSILDPRNNSRFVFRGFPAALKFLRRLEADPDAGINAALPPEVDIRALDGWGSFSIARDGSLGSPRELAAAIPGEIPLLRRVQGIVDPISTWMQSIEAKFPEFPVFSRIWEPVEAGALLRQQWQTPKLSDLAKLSRGTGDDQAKGMQLMWMFGQKNKGAAGSIKEWYRMSENDVAKGDQFRQKLIESGNDHGLNMDDFVQNQLGRIMESGGSVDAAFPREIPKESLFFRSAFREDEISARHIDIRDLSQRLTRMMAKETFLRPAIDVAEAMMDGGLNRVKGLAGPVRQYLDAKVAIPPQSRVDLQNIIRDVWAGGVEFVQNNVVKRIGTTKMDEAFSRHLEKVRTQDLVGPWLDWWLSNVYGALMAYRPGVVIRNIPQSMLTILPRVGPKAWLLGMRDALREGGFEEARLAGAIDDTLPLAFSEEIAETVARKQFGGGPLGKLFTKTDTFTRTGLVPFTAVDRFHRVSAYHAMKHLVQASTKAAPDVWARASGLRGQPRSVLENKRLAEVSEAIGIDMFGPIQSRQANAMLAEGRVNDLISYLGRNLAGGTQWIYGAGNQAGIGRGTIGKVFFNFSTWPTWFGRYAVNLTKHGTPRNKAKAIATFVAVNEGMFLAGREVFGVDASHWLYWHPLNYGGGTNLQAAIALVQAEFLETPNNRLSFRQRQARRVLETYWEKQVPGFGAGKDIYRFFGANSPAEAVRKATGFPKAGPESLSVSERALSLVGVDVGQAGRQGRRDVELVPLP